MAYGMLQAQGKQVLRYLLNIIAQVRLLATIPYPQLFNLVLVVSCCIVRVLVT